MGSELENLERFERLYEIDAEQAGLKSTYEAASSKLAAEAKQLRTIIAEDSAGLDREKIALAETIIAIRGRYSNGGDERGSVIRDAIRFFVTDKGATYPLWDEYYGTKSYDRWHGQREDHKYGYGPRHGSIIFAVYLRDEVRQRNPRGLTGLERDACVYYLSNIERIEAARAKAAA